MSRPSTREIQRRAEMAAAQIHARATAVAAQVRVGDPTAKVETRDAAARLIDPEAFDLIEHYSSIERFDGRTPAEREPDVFKAYPDLKKRRDFAYAKADQILGLILPAIDAKGAVPWGHAVKYGANGWGFADDEDPDVLDKLRADPDFQVLALYVTPPATQDQLRHVADCATSIIDWCDIVSQSPDKFASNRPDANLRGPVFDDLREALAALNETAAKGDAAPDAS